MKKMYSVVMETYKYDAAYESEEFDNTSEVLGKYADKDEARKKAEEEFDELIGEFREGEEYRADVNEVSMVLWDYTAVDDEGYVKKYIIYVK